MPTSISCKSASALDSLPRNANAKRTNTALYRLQHGQGAQSADEFGLADQRDVASSNNLEAEPLRATSPTGRRLRKLSTNLASPRRRQSKKTGSGVASSDLPLASSDLGDQNGLPLGSRECEALSDGDQDDLHDIDEHQDASIRVIGNHQTRVRAKSLSPKKVFTPLQLNEDNPSTPKSPHVTPSKPRPQPMPARKRVVSKSMIGNPSNFQHTGHVGAAGFGALQGDGNHFQTNDILRQQLSEVAAALKLDDETSSPEAVRGKEAPGLAQHGNEDDTLASEKTPCSISSQICPPEEHASAPQQPSPNNQGENTISHTGAGAGLHRKPSKRKPVPSPRPLESLYGEFDQSAAAVVPPETHVPSDTIAEAEEEADVKPLPTIRANGKRMVQGPAGSYITDTANVRWNNALSEIARALKDDGQEDEEQTEGDRTDVFTLPN